MDSRSGVAADGVAVAAVPRSTPHSVRGAGRVPGAARR